MKLGLTPIGPSLGAGVWWSSRRPERLPGLLDVVDGSLRLRLSSHPTAKLTGRRLVDHPPPLASATLLGVIGDTEVALHGCQLRGVSGTDDDPIVDIAVGFAVAGPHPKQKPLHLSRIELSLLNMNAWTERPPFRISSDPDAISAPRVEVSSHDRIELQLPGATATIGPSWTLSMARYDGNPLVRAQDGIDIRLDQAIRLESCLLDWVRPFQRLLCLATDRPCPVTRLRLGLVDDRRFSHEMIVPAELVGEPKRASMTPMSAMFYLSDVELPVLAQSWMRMHADWLEVIDLWEAAGARLPPHAYFLTVAAALEGLHRRIFEVEPTPKHLERLRRIETAIPKKDWRWLKGRLKHSHEPSLQQRLVALAKRTRVDLGSTPGDVRQWATDFSKVRNSVAHRDTASQSARQETAKLMRLAHDGHRLLSVALAAEIGVPAEALNRHVSTSHRRFTDAEEAAQAIDRMW
ncbi:MAG: HEPN domain-containing protein [Actinomycetota bacterium]